jgi:capsule polysaccharide modification protein KpsS
MLSYSELSTDFLYYMNKRFEKSKQNDKLRHRIFRAYKEGYGQKLGNSIYDYSKSPLFLI